MSLRVVPVSLRQANAYVEAVHRHSNPVRGCLFCLGAAVGDRVVGVGIVGRPVAHPLQDGYTAEVLRVCTDGTYNACSILYGAAWRGIKAMGYTRAVTYTLEEEGGASLLSSGWTKTAELPPRAGWDAPGRRRNNETYRTSARWRWQKGESCEHQVPEMPAIADPQESLL